MSKYEVVSSIDDIESTQIGDLEISYKVERTSSNVLLWHCQMFWNYRGGAIGVVSSGHSKEEADLNAGKLLRREIFSTPF